MIELQQVITSAHFTELQAFARRNTLSGDVWWSAANSMSMLVAAMSGQWVPPEMIVPGQVDPEKLREAKERAAEKAMDRQADRGNE